MQTCNVKCIELLVLSDCCFPNQCLLTPLTGFKDCCIGSCILECEELVGHLHTQMHPHAHAHTHTRMDRSRHPHKRVIILCVQKSLDIKNSSIPNVPKGRRPTAAGLPEVVAPFSHTVGLIHTHQGQGHEGGERLQQHGAVQPLWGHIQHPQPACLHQLHMCCVVPSAWQLSCGMETPYCEVSFTHMCCVVPPSCRGLSPHGM